MRARESLSRSWAADAGLVAAVTVVDDMEGEIAPHASPPPPTAADVTADVAVDGGDPAEGDLVAAAGEVVESPGGGRQLSR